MRRSLLTVVVALALALGLPATPPTAAASSSSTSAASAGRAGMTASRPVVFTVRNSNQSSVACRSDGRQHRLRGRLVGPRHVVAGRGGSIRLNVLVHDAGTGAWFWNLRQRPGVDYATQLARHGETSLVLDRLGYGSSTLRDGGASCLGSQVSMLHQVIQDSYAGLYRFTDATGRDPKSSVPHASSVIVHGHGTGSTIAQIEAAGFDDVSGLVQMSPVSTRPTGLALDVVRGQALSCLRTSRSYAAYGSRSQFRRLLFASASRDVRRRALRLRNPTPCGDVTSLAAGLIRCACCRRRSTRPCSCCAGAGTPAAGAPRSAPRSG